MIVDLKKLCECIIMTDTCQKLVCNLYDNKNFVVHIKSSKTVLRLRADTRKKYIE